MSKPDLKDIKAFLLDMDGTFYLSNQLLCGSLKFMDVLRSTGRDFLFLTNNSTRHSGSYAQKLTDMGFPVSPDKILTSGEATARYIKGIAANCRVFLLGTESLQEEFESYGFTLTDDNPDYCVLGFDTTLTYEKLWKLCDFLRAGTPYIATHPDFNCPVQGGSGFMPDTGAMIAFVEAATGCLPKVIGKPNAEIVSIAMQKLGRQTNEVCVIGDRLYTDIASGVRAGMLSALVLSGESSLADAEASEFKPDLIVDHLGALADLLICN